MRTLFTFLALLTFSFAYSTHIFGGYIAYKHLSGTTYQVQLTLYRDCYSATPFDGTAGSTTPAILGIFTGSTLIETRQLTNPVISVVIGDTSLPCTVPPSVCREIGVYTDTITLPSASATYTLVHERCCLRNSITNILNAGDQGSAITAIIPANSNNTSPSINLQLAQYIRIYENTSITNWCTDINGDSLAFSLSAPLSGASITEPAPNPPYGAPYSPVAYYPGYSASQPFGQASTCSINSAFGQIQIVPQGVGIFLMNVLVSEYRNGTLVSEYPILLSFVVTDCSGDTTGVVVPVDTNTTGIKDRTAEKELNIYPNPASNYITIENMNVTHDVPIAIIDVNGSVVLTGNMRNGSCTFADIAALPKGVYLVKVGNSFGRRFVKQ